MLNQFEMKNCTLVSISMKPKVINSLMSIIDEVDNVTIKWYQQLIESLMWSSMHTRLDLVYSVNVLSRYAHNLDSTHCALVKRVFKYIADIINVDLTFKQSNNHESNNQQSNLIDYSDSDFVESKDKKHSTKEYVFKLVDKTIIHSYKQQLIIVLSSCETEYVILSKTV
jgi:hypothetical protein